MISLKDRTVKVAINIAIIISIFLVLHFFPGRYIFRMLDKEKKAVGEMQKKLSEIETLVRNNPNPKKKIEEIKAKMEDFKRKAVSEKELPRIIQQLTKKSSELDIEIISIKPIDKPPFKTRELPQGVSKAYIEVVLKAPYKVLSEYIKALGEMPIVFTIESLVFEKFEGMEREKPLGEETTETSRKILATLLISSYSVWKL